MSSYEGLYVQRLTDGTVHSVQVKDSAGNQLPLDPQEYIRRGIGPPLETLPDMQNYRDA